MNRDRIIQLQECAEELGFSTIEEALNAGYHEVQDMVNGTFILKHVDEINADEQEKAHEAWLKERDEVLEWLEEAKVHNNENCGSMYINGALERAIEFVKKGEC